MLNRMQIEGVVLKTWVYANTPFAQLVHRPDPGIPTGDMLFIARLPPGTGPSGVQRGDQLRMHGSFFNRRDNDGHDRLIGEIHAESVVLIARDQLYKSRRSDDDDQAAEDRQPDDQTTDDTAADPD